MYYACLSFSYKFLFSLEWIIPLFYFVFNTLITSSAYINSFSAISSPSSTAGNLSLILHLPKTSAVNCILKNWPQQYFLSHKLFQNLFTPYQRQCLSDFLNLGGSLWLLWQIVVEVTVCVFWHQDIKRQLVFCLAVSLKALTLRSRSLLRESPNRPRWAEHIVRAEAPSWQPASTTRQVSKWPLR